MGICDYFIERLKEGENVDEFALWAFGEGYETKYAYQQCQFGMSYTVTNMSFIQKIAQLMMLM